MMLQPIWTILVPALMLLVFTAVWAVRQWSVGTGPARMGAIVRLGLATLAALIGLHPVASVQVNVARESPADVVVLLDRTTSMGALDFDGDQPRMVGAAADLTDLVGELAGARIAVIVFDDDARLAVPFTTDATSVTSFLQTVGWRPASRASGSDVSVAVELAQQTLREAGADRPDHERHLIYVGDGEQTAETARQSFEPLRDLVTSSLVLGYGTETGAPMRESPDGDALVRLDGQVQTSKIDQSVLRGIAEETGGTYHHRTRAGDLPDLGVEPAPGPRTELRAGAEYYWILALIAAGGLCLLGWSSVSALRAVREEVADVPQ